MWKPKYFHEMMTNRVMSTMSGSASQLVERRQADAVRTCSTRPSGWRSRLQTTPVMTSDDDVRREEDQAQDRAARGTAG